MNLEEKFYRWQEKMSKKSETERHNYALGIAILFGLITLFFVASSWYYRIFGGDTQTSYFTELEGIYNEQKANIKNIYNKF